MSNTPVINASGRRAVLVIKRGVGLSKILTLQDKDTGTPINLTSFTFAGGITNATTGDLIQALTLTITDAVNGKVKVSLTSGQTTSLTRGDYSFYIQFTDSGSDATLAVEGECVVRNVGES